ncbi:hypothetical protein [Floridanema evergladense]|uniref:Uncharacterized protein n=1 Tax=Floridaenema evergladense BLCC-F167 TaxID=3153639 RepID=A0ABV4WIH1_9CYAN
MGNAIANVPIQAGMDAQLAKQRGEDAAIAIQGSLILSQALDDTSLFRRTIEQLPIALLDI